MVFVDRLPALLPADAVLADNAGGAMTAVRHLIGHGHRRIAFLGDLAPIAPAEGRPAGYLAALREAGLAVDPAIIRRDLRTADATRNAASGLLTGPEPPTALFSG